MPPVPEPAPAGDPMAPRPFRVLAAQRETHDTWTLELAPADDGERPRFAPGQFNMIYLFGAGEVPISISGADQGKGTFLHTIRDVGGVTRGLCALRRGQVAGLRGPYGTPWPLAEAEGADVLVLSGGVGLAPLRPAIHHLIGQRRRYGRVAILYGARRPEEILFRRELERWRGRFDVEVQVTVDHSVGDWMGHVGVVTTLVPRANLDPANTVALVCGPEIMMRFSVRELELRGVARDSIYVSMERNMKCAVGLCGHCQLGPFFVCRDGPVFALPRIEPFFRVREL